MRDPKMCETNGKWETLANIRRGNRSTYCGGNGTYREEYGEIYTRGVGN